MTRTPDAASPWAWGAEGSVDGGLGWTLALRGGGGGWGVLRGPLRWRCGLVIADGGVLRGPLRWRFLKLRISRSPLFRCAECPRNPNPKRQRGRHILTDRKWSLDYASDWDGSKRATSKLALRVGDRGRMGVLRGPLRWRFGLVIVDGWGCCATSSLALRVGDRG